jgi:hypothetical protein
LLHLVHANSLHPLNVIGSCSYWANLLKLNKKNYSLVFRTTNAINPLRLDAFSAFSRL